jgi:hypothetical protein
MIYAMDAARDQASDKHTVDRPTIWVSAAVNGWCLRCDSAQRLSDEGRQQADQQAPESQQHEANRRARRESCRRGCPTAANTCRR